MAERIQIPIKYVGRVGENSLVPTMNPESHPLQILSREALEMNSFFKKISPAKQIIAIQTLSILGAYTISTYDRKWNSARWVEAWEDLNTRALPIIDIGIRETTAATMRQGFKNLFHMLEIGADSKEALLRQRALNSQEQSDHSSRGRHTKSGMGNTRSGNMVNR